MRSAKSVLVGFGLVAILFGCDQQNSVAPLPQEAGGEIEQAAMSASARGLTNFYFVGVNSAKIIDGVHHTLVMSGRGVIAGGKVVANGSFQHTDTDPEKPSPKPILGEGSWRAKRLLSFRTIGTYGIGVAGTLRLEVELLPVNGGSIQATLEVVCNIPPAKLFTGKPEGYTLTVAGAPFGAFNPNIPPIGITWITVVSPR